jgi:hypothetical protein
MGDSPRDDFIEKLGKVLEMCGRRDDRLASRIPGLADALEAFIAPETARLRRDLAYAIANLGATQERCGELLGENRALRAELEPLRAKANVAVCAWCGTETSKEPEVLLAHQAGCEARKDAYEMENRELRKVNAELVKDNQEVWVLVDRGIKLHEEADRTLAAYRLEIAEVKARLAVAEAQARP